MFDLGKETELKALGKPWRVGRMTLGVIEEFCDWVRRQVGDPFADLERFIDKLPREAALEWLREAREQRDALASLDLNSAVVQRHLRTLRGSVQMFWLMLRTNHPETTTEQAFAIAQEIGLVGVGEAIERGAGQSEGNGVRPAV